MPPFVPNIDVDRTASFFFRRYGDAAIMMAATVGFSLFADGDRKGCLTWLAIVRSIERLQALKPAEDETGEKIVSANLEQDGVEISPLRVRF
jgi:hypothetical protein